MNNLRGVIFVGYQVRLEILPWEGENGNIFISVLDWFMKDMFKSSKYKVSLNSIITSPKQEIEEILAAKLIY